MLRVAICFAVVVATTSMGAADAVKPATSNLRFAKVAAPATDQTKPLSTAMSCVMSLLFLYFGVVIILKTITFKKQFTELFEKIQADTGVKVPSIPGMGKEETKAEGEEGAPVSETAEPAATAGQGTTAASSLLENGVGQAKAASEAAVGCVKDMFSESKMEMIFANMSMVPMFCILITFCRLRARVDLESEPQPLAKTFMVVSTACLFLQILTCLLPNFPEKEGATGCTFGKAWAYTLMILNVSGMVGLYAGIGVICYTIFTLKYKEHGSGTEPSTSSSPASTL